MLIELVGGGPMDGDRFIVPDTLRIIYLQWYNPAVAFLTPLGPVPRPGQVEDGHVLLGSYVAQGEPPAEFLWAPEA